MSASPAKILSFYQLFYAYGSEICASLAITHHYCDEEASFIADMLYQFILPSFHLSNKLLKDKDISEFIEFSSKIIFRIKTLAIKQKKVHKKNIQKCHENKSEKELKNELYDLVQCKRILTDAQSMHTQIGRINNMLFGDYEEKLKNMNPEEIEMTNIMRFPYETQIYLEIGFIKEILVNNFFNNAYFIKVIRHKSHFFNELYEFYNILELFGVFWIQYKQKWNADELRQQNKLKKHYLGQCECCLSLYQSFYDDDETMNRSKMKVLAQELNVGDSITWSDEEIETEQEQV